MERAADIHRAWHPNMGLGWDEGSFDMRNDISVDDMIKSADFMTAFVALCEQHKMVPELYTDWMGFDLHIDGPHSYYEEHMKVHRQARDHMISVLERFGLKAKATPS